VTVELEVTRACHEKTTPGKNTSFFPQPYDARPADAKQQTQQPPHKKYQRPPQRRLSSAQKEGDRGGPRQVKVVTVVKTIPVALTRVVLAIRFLASGPST
jgi:hypothetical protein